ncbi:MAG: 50S ribosomal protein L11 methyltransferase [Bacteroidales bacterium]|jgi:ribosomal protein L11 methyltransferase|nr:50S ribosomal protein L11 methyltransferase [Bacteroidales bacterium]
MNTNYLEFTIRITPTDEYISDLLASFLGELGFESFERAGEQLVAYIRKDNYSQEAFESLINSFEYADVISFESKEIEQINWNEAWEKNYFEPILIDDICLIHSSFHTNLPNAKYAILIDPKMSFGTGHHETTSLMIAEMLKLDLSDKTVLDMGCGTSVLAILAAKKGANRIIAIDIDSWCVENSIENIRKNNASHIQVKQGDASLLKGNYFDVILANINRNILLQDMQQYAESLNSNGVLLMSGFYVEDIPTLEKEALNFNLSLQNFQKKNNWAVVKMIKQ